MQGRWIGEYTYGDNYPDAFKGKSVPFTFDIISNGVEFSGTFFDDETKYLFDVPGTLQGYIENNLVFFTKLYPCYWEIYPDGSIVIDTALKMQDIYYTGILTGNLISGEWEIPLEFIDEDLSYNEICGNGSFSMQKV